MTGSRVVSDFDGTGDGEGGENADEGEGLQRVGRSTTERMRLPAGETQTRLNLTSPAGLLVTEDDGAVGGASFGLLGGPVHGGIQLFEVKNAASDNLGVETLLKGPWGTRL